MPTHTTVVVIGAGQAGLAVSRVLTELAVDHVVLERGTVADRWRTRGWDSLTLLTPRWMSRLPRWRRAPGDPASYMSRADVVSHLEGYASSFAAPVVARADVSRVEAHLGRFAVTSTAGTWTADEVVVASGYCADPRIPEQATTLDHRVHQVHSDHYRNPSGLPDGGVLVVGASASGAQIADELRAAGRAVVLAVGRYTRLPRRYRGRDTFSWLSAIGSIDRPRTSLADPAWQPEEPSMQLVGRPDHDIDLPSLQDRGVVVAGRLLTARGSTVRLASDLPSTSASSDARLRRVLGRIDTLAAHVGAPPATAPLRTVRATGAPTELDLRSRGISTVVWATGYRRSYPWLDLPVLDREGEIIQRDGATPVAGVSVVGTPWQTRRSSALLHGVGHDAALVGRSIAGRVGALKPAHRPLTGARA